MTRWIAADESTAEALRERRIDSELVAEDAIGEALSTAPSVLVLPGGRDDVIVARVRRSEQPTGFSVHRWTDERAVGYQAGGMLGLLDEPVYEEEQPAQKKKWWQRKSE